MASTAKERAFNRDFLSKGGKLPAEIPTFSGSAKQYVRVQGWLSYIKDFIKRRAEAGITTSAKYLTLPGPNMTDIGVLWNAGLIQPPDEKIKIAICDKKYAERVVTQLGELGIQVVAYGNQMLHEVLKAQKDLLREEFPFDVVNLDLCDQLAGTKKHRNLDALQWIFRLQRGQRFLLLLTTRANENFDKDLVLLLEHHNESTAGFKNACAQIQSQLEDSTPFSRLVFPILIGKYAMTFGYQVIEHFAAYYSRPKGNKSHYDMLCHIFEFIPLKPTEEHATFAACFDQVPENEHQEKTRILLTKEQRDRVSEAYSNFVKDLPMKPFVNVDQLLDENQSLSETMQREDKALFNWWERVEKP